MWVSSNIQRSAKQVTLKPNNIISYNKWYLEWYDILADVIYINTA